MAGAAPAWADRGGSGRDATATGGDDLAAYARGRAADGDGRVAQSAAAYGAALSASPDNAAIARRAYREALRSGDNALVDRAIVVLDRAGLAPPDAPLLTYAGAVRGGNAAAASKALAQIGAGPFDFVKSLLAAWRAFDAGSDPFAPLLEVKANPVARRYVAENRALLQLAKGNVDEGLVGLQALLGADQASLDLRVNAAQLLAARGKPDIAATLLRGDDTTIVALRRSFGTIGAPTGAFGASRVLTRLAADLAEGDPTPLTISLTRAALRLDPGNDRARIILAQSLARLGASEAALAVLAEIPETSPFHEAALQGRVAVLGDSDRPAEALAVATSLSARKDATSLDAARLGGLLVGANRFDDAAKAYRVAIARAGDAPPWTLLLQLGAALDQGGHWPEARAALEKAVALAPQAAIALNYLGYAQLEHGENLAASVALLERANTLQPDQASIADSLAWAYFKRGDTARALPLLETAAKAEPANGTISEHLGDAYWSLGRRYEARYAWRAAAVVADGDDGARLAAKIANGVRSNP